MNAVENILWTGDALTQRVKLCRETGEHPKDLADLKVAATNLRLAASQVAVTLPPGRNRNFVTVIRRQAIRAENYARRQLAGGSSMDVA